MNKAMFVLAMLSLGTLCRAGSAREDATDRLENSTNVVHTIMSAPDNGIPEEVLEHAKCIGKVPVPTVAKPFLAEIRRAKTQAVAEGKAEAKEKDKN